MVAIIPINPVPYVRSTKKGLTAQANGVKKHYFNTAISRFWERVTPQGGGLSCWIWSGHKTDKGYGLLSFMGKPQKAHRIAYEITFGKIPDGLLICHLCDNPACCNPCHLVAATAKENTEDMIKKNRSNFFNNLPNIRGRINE